MAYKVVCLKALVFVILVICNYAGGYFCDKSPEQ